MATIGKRGGQYYVDYRFRGKRVRKSAGPDLRLAEDILRDVQGRIVRDDAGLGILDITTEKAIADFLKDRRDRNTRKWADYQEKILKAFVEKCGVRLLRRITPAMIDAWQRERKRKTSVRTAQHNFTTVRAWLRWAKRMKYIQEDPSENVQPLGKPPKKEIRFLTEKEAEKLLQACREPVPLRGPGKKGNGKTRDRQTPLFEIVAVGLYAGLRLGEILHLRWEDVDFQSNGGVLHVRVTDEFTPKDKEGRRIPLHSKLRKILEANKRKAWEKKGFLFLTAGGQIFDNRNLLRELELAAERAGVLDGCNFTLLRHTFASWLTMKGVSLHKISKFLGHSSVSTTEKHYAGLVPESLHADIEKLGS